MTESSVASLQTPAMVFSTGGRSVLRGAKKNFLVKTNPASSNWMTQNCVMPQLYEQMPASRTIEKHAVLPASATLDRRALGPTLRTFSRQPLVLGADTAF